MNPMKCPKCGSEMEIPSDARRAVKGIWRGYWYCENCGYEEKVRPVKKSLIQEIIAGRIVIDGDEY